MWDGAGTGTLLPLWGGPGLSPLPSALPWAFPGRVALRSLLRVVRRNPNLAEKYRRRLNKIQAENVPIDIKPVNPPDIFTTEQQEPKQLFWVRARGYIGGH